ncbi:Acyl dehydratase [Streptomyces sp. DvalAA-14]|uniref:MaoC family dehydratase N-terminal domain-containing protein n=1 Tax=unclassified Streptomyces TaxID=2593676 RepID=UPI00081B1954|nr:MULTISPECIES: MaoC family dehydratase N-terminal domain-containing protein [unclassified Streptomyces]MYS24479.1 MaoC family dehydratase [Streptomyces sp. SID4948]SCE46477.1 Acyl dehydratase [Streptomyces sp. DvalAA-14]
MALDQSFVGRSYPPTAPYEVGREKIREFAAAIGDPHPAYTDPDAAKALGHLDVIAPPTFAFTITYKAAGLVISDPELGLDYSRVVHGDQKFAYTRPVRAGDRLTVTSTIEAIKSMAGNDILDIRGEVRDESGAHVVTAWTKLVSRAATPEPAPDAPVDARADAPADAPAAAKEGA